MKEGMTERKNLPWYKTILFKHICIFIITVLPGVLLFTNLYRTFQKEVMRNVTETTLSRDQQIFENFYSKIDEAQFYALNMYNEPDLYLLSDLWDNYSVLERAEKIGSIQNNMQWYRFMEWFISDIKIYLLRDNVYINQNYWAEMKPSDMEDVERYFTSPEDMRIENGNVYFYVGSLTQGTRREQIRFLCRMSISAYKFQQMVQEISSDGMAESVVLIDGDILVKNMDDRHKMNELIAAYQSLPEEEKGESFEFSSDGSRYFCSRIGTYNNNITVLTCRSFDAVFGKTQDSFRLILVMIIANILVFLIFIIYVQRFVKKPISILSDAFWRMHNGEEEVQVHGFSRDEFDDLYVGFNDMSKRLAVNIRENYLNKIALQREQLKQFQAQINPHFLYNTLLFIKIRIKRHDLEGAEKMTGLLSDYYRFLNRNAKDIIPLGEELTHVFTYMNIQSERFARRFRFVVRDYPEEWNRIPVPRLLLQPLVENAVKYGVEQIEEDGEILLYLEERDNKIFVIIEEKGISVSQEETDQMNERIRNPGEDGEITSTININRRIKLFYGDNYELRFERISSSVMRTVVELDGEKNQGTDAGDEERLSEK